MRHDLFELSVAVPSKHGSSKIPEYGHKGLTFVEGRRGQPYILNLRNNSAQRVLAVVSIDGQNIVDGQPCTPSSRGYVIPAYSSVDIEGWRTSLSEVHKFKFEAKAESYAKSMTGEVQNCGIIAAKFFSEKWNPPVIKWMPTTIVEHHHHHHQPRRYPSWPDVWYTCTTAGATGSAGASGPSGLAGETLKCSSGGYEQYSCSLDSKTSHSNVTCCMASAANMAQADVPDFKLGTGWGEAKADFVSETAFERERELCTLSLYYAEAADLERVGIQLAKELTVTASAPVLPQAFAGFCKPPVSH